MNNKERTLASRDTAAIKMNPLRPFIAGIAISFLGLMALAFAASRIGIVSDLNLFTSANERSILIAGEDVVRMRAILPELRNIVDELENKIDNHRAELVIPNNKFNPVSSVWPEGYNKLSLNAKIGLGFLVKIDGPHYKILLDGKLCTLAKYDGIFPVDPVREKNAITLCRYFSAWKGEGIKF